MTALISVAASPLATLYVPTLRVSLFISRVKRGDYLIVSGDAEDAGSSAGSAGVVQFRVEHILYKDQVRNIKSKGLWPPLFDEPEALGGGADQTTWPAPPPPEQLAASLQLSPPASGVAADGAAAVEFTTDAGDAEMEHSDSDEEPEGELFVNTNRRQVAFPAPESSSEEDEDE
jgi:probable RNA-binding protein EIF1AD